MASLTTTPSRLLRSPTAYPFAFFLAAAFGAFDDFRAALGAFGFDAFAATFFGFRAAGSAGAAGFSTAGGATMRAAPRSRLIVYARARSRRAIPSRDGFLATPIDSWNRRLKISSDSSRAFWVSSSSERSRHFAAFIALSSQAPRPGHELRGDADLVGRRPECLARHVLGHALHLIQDATRLHHGHPLLGIALALAHARLGRLLGHRLVGKHTDPHLAATLQAAGERNAGRLDLAVGDPARLQRLETVLPEGQRGAPLGLAAHVAALGLAVLDALGHQHESAYASGGVARSTSPLKIHTFTPM